MATISDLQQYGELAQASYADLPSGIFGDQISYTKPLEEEKFTAKQASIFADRYRVLATSQEYSIGSESGFSATLFEDTENPDKKILAIRGTDQIFGVDWDDDIGFGLATGDTPLQFEDMVAFFEILKNETDPTKRIDSGEKLDVTGHSLGGALAQAFTATYKDFVDQSYTYNSPGAKDLESPEFQ